MIIPGIYDQISFNPGRTPNPDQWVTMGDYLRGLYTLPGERNHVLKGKLPGEIEDARERMKAARRNMKAERAAYQRKGMKLPKGNESRLAHSQAVKDLKGLETDLSAAEAGKGELPLTRALNAHLGDVAKEIAGIDLARTMPKELEFLKDVPIIDVTASGVAAELQSRDDIDKGWSPAQARAADYGSAGIGLAAGAGAGAVAGALSVSTGGAALIGGVAAVGVGDFVYQGFHEHWSEDMAQHGALGGVATGVEHMGEHTGEDVENMAVGAWHGAQHLWHSIFG